MTSSNGKFEIALSDIHMNSTMIKSLLIPRCEGLLMVS